jgi:predicted transposase YbfD/YdcC
MKQTTQSQEAQEKHSTESSETVSARAAYSREAILFDVGSLCAQWSHLTDGRKAKGKRYSLVTMLLLMVIAKLCGQDTPEAMADWAHQRRAGLVEMLKLKHRTMPHAATFGRVLRKAIQPEALEREMQSYFAQQAAVRGAQQYCLDGKQIRGTELVAGEGNVYLLGVFVPDAGVMLAQVELASKEGELTQAPRVIKTLDLRGKLVTGDAAFTQRHLSIEIVEAGGDYLWKVKDNQPTLLAQIELLFEPPTPARPGFSNPVPDFRTCSEITCAHGRIEKRTLTASSLLQGSSDWPHLAQVFKLECELTYKKSGETFSYVTYGVTSQRAAQASPRTLLHQARAHWGIEGASHQRRDVTFHEDFCDLRRGHSAHLMAILNNIAIALITRAGFVNAAHARRFFAAQPQDAFNLLITA